MRFSPLLVSTLIVKPLRYLFNTYSTDMGLHWDEDPKKRTIEIGTVNDYNRVTGENKPRVLVNRGTYAVTKSGLTDSMAMAKGGIKSVYGEMNRTNMVWINGQAQIIIEARQEGTCELITDMVSHFIVWSRPMLCDTQGFSEFGLDMQVSDCQPDREDTEKFKSQIIVPYRIEEQWNVRWDSVKLKSFFATIEPDYRETPKQIIMR